MPYRYKIGIDEPGKAYREVNITYDSDKKLKSACNVLLRPKTKVTIIKRTKVKSGGK